MLHIKPYPAQVDANRRYIEKLILTASDNGARWIVTPELCISGYYFSDVIGIDWIQPQPDEWMKELMNLTYCLGLTVFLSYPERDGTTNKLYNSLFVIQCGRIIGRHRKIEVHPGLEEGWASPGDSLEPILVGGTQIGLLVCADTWETKYGRILAGKESQLIIESAAWGHKYPPMEHWTILSTETKLPLWVCNRTGIERNVDWTRAESTVIQNGEPVLRYHGEGAILLFNWNIIDMKLESREFEVLERSSVSTLHAPR